MGGNRDYSDWTATIASINGGVQETNDFYTNLAPESDYQPSLVINMRKDSKDYKHLIHKRFYFTSNDKKEYGVFSIKIEPFARKEEEACAIFINYKINATGSRNLELKRNNTSQPQLSVEQKLASNV